MTSARTTHTPKFIVLPPASSLRPRPRAARADLQDLSDHHLRDIGLTRADAHSIAAGIHPQAVEQAPGARTALRALMGGLARLWAWYERHRAMRSLMALDDRALKDMGLHRSGIADAVRTGRDRPPVTATG